MRTKKDMRYYLRLEAPRDALARMVLRQGTWFLGRARADDYRTSKEWKTLRRPRAQRCFYNSQRFCVDHTGYKYFEGFMLIGGLPMHHAWVLMQDGRVVDFTLEAVLRKAKRDKAVVDLTTPLYNGLAVPRWFILRWLIESRCGEPLAESYYADSERAGRRLST